MYAIMGVTGQVGGAAVEALLQAGQRVRAIVRDKAKAKGWESKGVELAVADWTDGDALQFPYNDPLRDRAKAVLVASQLKFPE